MITIKNLTKTYNYKNPNAFTALSDISLTVEDKEMLAVIGKSGAGKSTLLHIIGCIDTFEKGEMVFHKVWDDTGEVIEVGTTDDGINKMKVAFEKVGIKTLRMA